MRQRSAFSINGLDSTINHGGIHTTPRDLLDAGIAVVTKADCWNGNTTAYFCTIKSSIKPDGSSSGWRISKFAYDSQAKLGRAEQDTPVKSTPEPHTEPVRNSARIDEDCPMIETDLSEIADAIIAMYPETDEFKHGDDTVVELSDWRTHQAMFHIVYDKDDLPYRIYFL